MASFQGQHGLVYVWVSCRGMGSLFVEKFALPEIASRIDEKPVAF